jgi:hypothetical protein
MKVIKIGDLKGLMQHVTEIKFSNKAVMFKGVYYNAALAENTPFCLLRTLSELDPKEYTQLMELTLPNGHKVYEVFAKIKEHMSGAKGFIDMPAEKKLQWIACHENHIACKHYGGTSNYCHKLHEIIKTPCRCGFFDKK